MTFQHGGHGCIGVGSVLGEFGIHSPDPKPQPGGDHHFGGGFGGGPKGPKGGMSESMGLFPDQPMGLIFGDPEAAAAHHYSLAAIPIGGGWTLSIVALLMALCLLAVLASASYRTVAVQMLGIDWGHVLEAATVVVLVLAMINMLRMTWYMVGADLFMVGRAKEKVEPVPLSRR